MSIENTPTAEQTQHGFFLIIPAFVADDPDLDDATKMLFGRIAALSNRYGYCFASDKYISDLCGCGDRVITDRLKNLEKKGYIVRETYKEGMIQKRKIYPLFDVQKSFTAGTTMPSRTAQPCPPGGNARAHKQDNVNSIRETTTAAPPPAAAFSKEKLKQLYDCLAKVDIPEKDKHQIQAAYPEDAIKSAIAWAMHPDTKIKTTLVQAIKWACANKPASPHQSEEENKKFAEEIEKKLKPSQSFRMDILAKGVEFCFLTCGKEPVFLNFSANGFKDQIINNLRKFSLI